MNKPQTDAEVRSLRVGIPRGVPFGDNRWIKSSTVRLSLETTSQRTPTKRVLTGLPPFSIVSGKQNIWEDAQSSRDGYGMLALRPDFGCRFVIAATNAP